MILYKVFIFNNCLKKSGNWNQHNEWPLKESDIFLHFKICRIWFDSRKIKVLNVGNRNFCFGKLARREWKRKRIGNFEGNVILVRGHKNMGVCKFNLISFDKFGNN